MQAVFSELNLDRYRKLASGTLTVAERKIIFDCLAQEGADFSDNWTNDQRCVAGL
jgi:hypothetical protein